MAPDLGSLVSVRDAGVGRLQLLVDQEITAICLTNEGEDDGEGGGASGELRKEEGAPCNGGNEVSEVFFFPFCAHVIIPTMICGSSYLRLSRVQLRVRIGVR